MADGVLDTKEEELLKSTTSIFGINSEIFTQLKNQFSSSTHDPYSVLGVEKNMPFEEIKNVYLRKRREFHPDTLLSKGLPSELMVKAKERFIEIQKAFEAIEKKKF